MKNLTTPIKNKDLKKLTLGDKISISGTIYTGRDAALPKLVRLIEKDAAVDLVMDVPYREAWWQTEADGNKYYYDIYGKK